MLQNPSKYHANPLSHFLALHTSQAAHNAHSHALPTTAGGHNQFHQHHQTIMANHHASHHLSAPHPHAHLIDATNTSLDVGKSFTIAAILGLQKSAIESNRQEYNNVINLSLNNGNHQPPSAGDEEMVKVENRLGANCGNNNNNSSRKASGSNGFNGIGSFNCDSNAAALVNRYLPSVPVSTAASFVAASAHHQQTLASSHARANSFVAAAAVAAAAAANASGGGPSALQSLQQLHQHHAQQSSLTFQREKLKAENNAKKSSLKNKRVRTIFTPEQLERLEAEFERQQYMVGPERLYLAHTLQLTEAQVKVWFQNRRIKWRKHHLEITQQRLALLRQNQLPNTSITPAENRATVSSPNCEETDDAKHNEAIEIKQLSGSRHASESDLSICNDSTDAESVIEGGEDT